MIKIGIGSRYFAAASAGNRVYAFPAYEDCSTSSTNGVIYYATTPTFAINTVLYIDPELTEFASEISSTLKEISLNNGVQITTNSSGAINSFTRCYQSYTFYEFCVNSGGTQTLYTRFNDTLADGVFLYVDENLTSLFVNGIRTRDNVKYSASSTGEISVTYCTTSLTLYPGCYEYYNDQLSFIAYARNLDYTTPMNNGTKLYSDSNGLIEIGSQGFVDGGFIYLYQNGSGTQGDGVCSPP
jgi:hypothetical protein